jgi:tagatose-6-phosphate ketose/aldose isomerase
VCLPPESNDRSRAMTSSFTCMTVAGYSLGYLNKAEAYRAMVAGLSRAAESILDQGSKLAAILSSQKFGRAFFLASRPSVAAVHEAQLKIQELTAGRIIAEAEDTLGFRHGFMSALDEGSLVVLFLSGDPRRRSYELDLLRELRSKALGKRLIAVAPRVKAAESLSSFADEVLEYDADPAVKDEVRAPLVVLPGQLLGLYFSMAFGLKPDAPSPAGIINRVVQGVTIYPLASGI